MLHVSAWTQVTLPSALSKTMAFPQAVLARASDDVWVVGQDNKQRLSIAHWDGQTWIDVPVKSLGLSENTFTGVAAGSAGQIWAVGSYAQQYGVNQALIERYIP